MSPFSPAPLHTHRFPCPGSLLPQERKGFSSVCVTDSGKVGGKLLGLVTTRDYDFVTNYSTPLSEVMTADLETAEMGGWAGRGGWQRA